MIGRTLKNAGQTSTTYPLFARNRNEYASVVENISDRLVGRNGKYLACTDDLAIELGVSTGIEFGRHEKFKVNTHGFPTSHFSRINDKIVVTRGHADVTARSRIRIVEKRLAVEL